MTLVIEIAFIIIFLLIIDCLTNRISLMLLGCFLLFVSSDVTKFFQDDMSATINTTVGLTVEHVFFLMVISLAVYCFAKVIAKPNKLDNPVIEK